MLKNKLKFSSYLIIGIVLTLGLSISLQSLLADWTAPTASPPGDNIDSPINTGSSGQVKLGNLSLYNNLYVGNGTTNDVLFVDNTGGKVGIGTTNPQEELDVNGILRAKGIDCVSDMSLNDYGIYNVKGVYGRDSVNLWISSDDNSPLLNDINYYANNHNFYVQTTAGGRARIFYIARDNSNAGNVYINVKTSIGPITTGYVPSEYLEVSGNVLADAFLYSSDKSLKKNIKQIDNALEKIQALEGVSFKWKDNDEKTNLGLIAQDVEKVFPELVSTNKTTSLKSVQYGNLVAPLIEAIKEQQEQIKVLQEQIQNLENKISQ